MNEQDKRGIKNAKRVQCRAFGQGERGAAAWRLEKNGNRVMPLMAFACLSRLPTQSAAALPTLVLPRLIESDK